MHVVDAIHTRMGASDDISRGRSTFLEVCSMIVPGYFYSAVLARQLSGCLRHPELKPAIGAGHINELL